MTSPGSAQTGKLLVVDDNRVNRLLLGRALEQLGHTVTFAENGREGLEALRRQRVDLILLDIEMPEMDGYQALAALAADPHLRDIPVVMMSSVEEVDSVARCIEMGAEDYLFKPVNPVLLRARVGASLEKKRLRDRQRELFRKFATAEVAEELLTSGLALGGKHVEASVMFSDIRKFTSLTETLSPADTIELLNSYYTLMFDAIGGQGGIVNQMLGDGLMAIFGAPLPRPDHRQRAVSAALEMQELVAGFNREQAARGGAEIRIGIGIASGPLVAGFTGTEQRVTYTCVGDTVNLAAHLEAHTKVLGQPILIDENTRTGLADGVRVESHGSVQFKTRSRVETVYSVVPARVAAPGEAGAVSGTRPRGPRGRSRRSGTPARPPSRAGRARPPRGARGTTTTKPMPMLKTRNISASSIRPPRWSHRKTSGDRPGAALDHGAAARRAGRAAGSR